MMAWVTDSPSWANNRTTSLDYRFLSSMQGGLGIGANLNRWSDADFADAARMVAAYKQVRQTVQRGALYRLVRPGDASGRVANLYVSGDRRQAVLFAFLHSSTELNVLPRIALAGLDPARRYRARAIDSAASADDEVHSGAYWMAHGIGLPMKGDFQATGRIFEAADQER
jgi:alpha-galactosidase